MSKTSLGQRNDLLRRQHPSTLKAAHSSVRPTHIQRFIQPSLNLAEQIQTFLFMKQKLAKLERQHQYYTCEPGDTYRSVKDNYGIHIFANGDRYMGEWKDGSMDGMGLYIFSDVGSFKGLVYLGDFLGGLFHGIGKLAYFQDNLGKMVYYGSWAQGKKTNIGVHYYENPHTYYIGEWNSDLKHGEGKLIFPDGEFKGIWEANERNGLGSLVKRRKNGSTVWEGNWKNDQLAFGIIVYYEGNIELGRYEGEIRDGKKHGVGTYRWKGALYEGQFVDDYIRGRGKFVIGRVELRGEQFNIRYDLLAGPELAGEVVFDNGDKFEGWLAIREGRVVLVRGKYDFNSPKDRAEGEFIDTGSGQLRGSFTYVWANGQQQTFNN